MKIKQKIPSKLVLPAIIGVVTTNNSDGTINKHVFKQPRIFHTPKDGKPIEYVKCLLNGSIQTVRRSRIVE